MPSDSALGDEMTLAIFKLNGQLLVAGEAITRPEGITVAWWQVLGAVLRESLTASGIGRQMGITRQAVQRVANRLIDEGMLESTPNPSHKRSPLLTPTAKGRSAIKKIAPEQTAFSSRIVASFGRDELQHVIAELHRLSAVIAETQP